MTRQPGGGSLLPTVVRWALIVVGVATLSLLSVGAKLPGLSARGWEASASARLVVDRPGAVPYDEDALGRDAVLLTFATMTANSRFVREALAQRGLTAHRQDYSVTVTNSPQSALITVGVRGPDAGAVRALAVAIRAAATSRINRLAPVYRLRPDAEVPPAPVTLLNRARHRRSLAGAALATALVAAIWVRRARTAPPRRSFAAGS